jgi:hypothetical protein
MLPLRHDHHQIQLAAMTARLSKKDRATFLYVDEFQNFATSAREDFVSTRKYCPDPHQPIDRAADEIQRAIFGNVGTPFCHGESDVDIFSKEFAGLYTADLVNLGRHEIVPALSQYDLISRRQDTSLCHLE